MDSEQTTETRVVMETERDIARNAVAILSAASIAAERERDTVVARLARCEEALRNVRSLALYPSEAAAALSAILDEVDTALAAKGETCATTD